MAFEKPPIPDEQIRELYEFYLEAERELVEGYEALVYSGDEGKFETYQALLALLLALTSRTRLWASRTIETYLEEADDRVVSDLLRIRPGTVFDDGVPPGLRASATRDLLGHLYKARNILEQAIGRIYRSMGVAQDYPGIAARVGSGNPSLAPETVESRVRQALVKEFRDTPVSVIGKGGKTFKFPLPYYAAMVAHNAKFQAESVATIRRSLEAGHDLVIISNNPSLHGDWCDAYRGRVFSITGMTPGFAVLDQLPNEGAPFHPWCRHSMRPFDAKGKTAEELGSIAQVDPRFLLSQSNDFNTMVRAWWASKREQDG